MQAIRISLISAIVITSLLICFGFYQYFGLGNENVIRGPADSGFTFIALFLIFVFFFVVALLSFVPSVIGLFRVGSVQTKFVPILVAIGSIVVCFTILFYSILPVINSVNGG